MAIRFVDKSSEPSRKRDHRPEIDAAAQAEGEARFATPIEAPKPVNPDAGTELPFGELPLAEKAARKSRGRPSRA